MIDSHTRRGKALIGLLVILALVAADKLTHPSHSSAPAAAVAASTGSAKITMLTGASSDNHCEEVDGDAKIYVAITLRNSGDVAGTVNPWAAFDYSDGGNSEETYLENYGRELRVPAHTVVDATFAHTFNPQQHTLLRCTGYTDLDGNGPGHGLPATTG